MSCFLRVDTVHDTDTVYFCSNFLRNKLQVLTLLSTHIIRLPVKYSHTPASNNYDTDI
jgi:hypothetical protein